ncbi:MAG: site-2 protease family protein [Dehalococcoidia bacterium]
MLLFNTDLLLSDPASFVILVAAIGISLVMAISVHEWAHAYAANRLGDMTATRLGRLTLNPKAHLDPAGSIMILVAGFGWGRPVPVNPARLLHGRAGMAMVSFAGPLSNVVMAFLFAALFQLGLLTATGFTGQDLRGLDPVAWVTVIAMYGVILNLILAAFNLLPIPPLDGGGILSGIVPRNMLPAVAKLQVIGPVVLMGLILSSFVTDLRILSTMFAPVMSLADALIYR